MLSNYDGRVSSEHTITSLGSGVPHSYYAHIVDDYQPIHHQHQVDQLAQRDKHRRSTHRKSYSLLHAYSAQTIDKSYRELNPARIVLAAQLNYDLFTIQENSKNHNNSRLPRRNAPPRLPLSLLRHARSFRPTRTRHCVIQEIGLNSLQLQQL